MHVIINKTNFKHNLKKMIRKEKPAYFSKFNPAQIGLDMVFFTSSQVIVQLMEMEVYVKSHHSTEKSKECYKS